ncbi:MAG: stage II sporulation protein R [Clostridia bacterium]|nr:stage II sporulation protein R [Clostridia bacterium]
MPRARPWPRFRTGLAALGLLLLAAPFAVAPVGRLAPAPGDGLVRVRFLAQSDSPFDQAVKSAVRDAVLATFGPEWRRARSASELASLIREELPLVAAVAQEAAEAAGAGYGVEVAFEDAWFPAERLGPVTIAPGREPSLVVTLGAGRGRNWWGVLFPPLSLLPVPWDALSSAGAPGTIDLAGLDPELRLALAQALGRGGADTPSEAVVAFRLRDDTVLVVDRRLVGGGDADPPAVELRSYFADALREVGARILRTVRGLAELAQARP